MSRTLITLIPKGDRVQSLKDLRLISLCNVTYKIVSKVLCNRLKKVLENYIAPFQSAYLKGRLITDNIILAADVLHQIHGQRHTNKKLAALKIDFSKAFDRLSWDFISTILLRMGFPRRWIQMITQYIFTVSS